MYPQYQNVTPPPPVKQPRSRFSSKMILFAVGGLLAISVAIGLLVASSGTQPISQMQRLSARLETLREIISLGDKHTRNPDMRKIHSDASILVASTSVAVNDAMAIGKIPTEVSALEADEATLKTLADANLNGRFDDAYQKALAQKLESTMALMKEIHDKTNKQVLRTSLNSGYEHFGSLLDQLAKL